MKNYKKHIESEIQHSKETIESAERKIKELKESIKIEKKISERFKSLIPNSVGILYKQPAKSTKVPSAKYIAIQYAQNHLNDKDFFRPKDLREYAKKVYNHQFSNSIFSWALRRLIEEGLMKKAGKGKYKYSIPEKAEQPTL